MTQLNRLLTTAGFVLSLLVSGCGDDATPRPDAGPDATVARCGDNVVNAGESCDDGNNTTGDGCEADCSFSCATNSDCDDGEACNGAEACNTTLHRCQAATPAADGSACVYYGAPELPDGGMGELAQFSGLCVSGVCGAPCTLDMPSCDDGDACNGVESCHPTVLACAPGTPLVCDDGLACTTDSCDPSLGCQLTLIDEDADGFADKDVACGQVDGVERGGDCDDGDNTVYPGAAELCADGKDNDCDGDVDDSQPFWYLDCDGDGYAAASAVSQQSCDQPAPQGSCGWTTRIPSGLSTTDCNDLFSKVLPGAGSGAFSQTFFTRPYCAGTGLEATGTAPNFACASGTISWDYNCNGVHDLSDPSVGSACISETSGPGVDCGGSWAGLTAPTCGYSAPYVTCGPLLCDTPPCGPACGVITNQSRLQGCR